VQQQSCSQRGGAGQAGVVKCITDDAAFGEDKSLTPALANEREYQISWVAETGPCLGAVSAASSTCCSQLRHYGPCTCQSYRWILPQGDSSYHRNAKVPQKTVWHQYCWNKKECTGNHTRSCTGRGCLGSSIFDRWACQRLTAATPAGIYTDVEFRAGFKVRN
jgi:hypothetical protein